MFFALLFAIPAAARAATTVTYSFDKAFAPFSFVEKGKAKGFELDILQAALAASGFKLNIKPGNWDQIQRDLDQGKVQVSSGAAKTPERMQKYLYAASPTCKLNVRIFTENKKPIRTITDLPGKRVATQRGSLYHSLIKNIKNINLVLFDTEPQALKALVDGKADAAVIAEKTGRYYINKEGYKNISAVGTPLRMTSVFFIFNKKQQKLAKAVSEGLRNIVSNGQYEKIYKRWFVPKLDENEAAALLKAAALSVRMAYAPYSRFQVGAAVFVRLGPNLHRRQCGERPVASDSHGRGHCSVKGRYLRRHRHKGRGQCVGQRQAHHPRPPRIGRWSMNSTAGLRWFSWTTTARSTPGP